MSVAVIGLIGTVISVLGTAGYAGWRMFVARRKLANTPAMQANAQAGADTALEEEAKAAVNAANAGKPEAEETGDAS